VNTKLFAHFPSVGTKEFTDAHKWLELQKRIVTKNLPSGKLYFFPAFPKDKTTLTKEELKSYISARIDLSWATFDEFATREASVHFVSPNSDN
jgi:hypothetical protein